MKLYNNIAISKNGFVFNPNTGDSFTLNEIGLEIVNELKLGRSQDEIHKFLVQRYEVDSVTLEKNLLDFMAMLSYYELLEPE